MTFPRKEISKLLAEVEKMSTASVMDKVALNKVIGIIEETWNEMRVDLGTGTSCYVRMTKAEAKIRKLAE